MDIELQAYIKGLKGKTLDIRNNVRETERVIVSNSAVGEQVYFRVLRTCSSRWYA